MDRQHERIRRRVNPDLIVDYLGGLGFPCSKEQIVRLAGRQNAPQEVQVALERLPNEQYSSLDDIMRRFRQTP